MELPNESDFENYIELMDHILSFPDDKDYFSFVAP